VKGFGDETPTTQFDVEALFVPYGQTMSVRLRRASNRLFKGSAFIEFADEETQKAFLKTEPKPKWKGHDLLIMSKKAYVEGKAKDIADGKIKPYRNRRHTDPDDWKKRREEDQKSGFKNDRRGNKGGKSHGSHRNERVRGGRDRHRRDERSSGRNVERDERYV
jgi:lupus La protein